MTTLYYHHSDFLFHETGVGHPECPERLVSIASALENSNFSSLIRVPAPLGNELQIRLVHSQVHVEAIIKAAPKQGYYYLDQDTVLSTGSTQAAFRAVGAVCDAVDRVVSGEANNAFCAIRPPGHHAEVDLAMGFCLFNNVAIATEYARQYHQINRIAIIDFDVHHGNGTQAIFFNQPNVLYVSSHELFNYPGTGSPKEIGLGNIINVPLFEGDTGIEFREKYSKIILPALRDFKPEILLISAGFDAHRDDSLGSIMLLEDDFEWVTKQLMCVADSYCKGRIISVLEGGYNLKALASSVAIHIKTLMNH